MASKQLWRWHGITGDGNAQDGMLWAESRALLLMALQQQMVTPLSLKRIAINSAQWRGDKSAEVIHQLATLLKAGLTLSEGLALLRNSIPVSNGKRCCNRWRTISNRALLFPMPYYPGQRYFRHSIRR